LLTDLVSAVGKGVEEVGDFALKSLIYRNTGIWPGEKKYLFPAKETDF